MIRNGYFHLFSQKDASPHKDFMRTLRKTINDSWIFWNDLCKLHIVNQGDGESDLACVFDIRCCLLIERRCIACSFRICYITQRWKDRNDTNLWGGRHCAAKRRTKYRSLDNTESDVRGST